MWRKTFDSFPARLRSPLGRRGSGDGGREGLKNGPGTTKLSTQYSTTTVRSQGGPCRPVERTGVN